MASAEPIPSRRERTRAATIDEIKQTALRLMGEHGNTDVRFSDIARAMGMTAPALYRYFADRDELLSALITDAYDDLGAAIAKARDAIPETDVGGRLLAVCQAYRMWARREPQRFALIFGLPVPGYTAPEEGPTTEAARRAMTQLKAIFVDAATRRRLRRPILREVADAIRRHCAEKHAWETAEPGMDIPVDTFQAMMHAWAGLHGFTCLETYGHFNWMEPDAVDALFIGQVQLAAKAAGLPPPDQP